MHAPRRLPRAAFCSRQCRRGRRRSLVGIAVASRNLWVPFALPSREHLPVSRSRLEETIVDVIRNTSLGCGESLSMTSVREMAEDALRLPRDALLACRVAITDACMPAIDAYGLWYDEASDVGVEESDVRRMTSDH